MTDQLPAGTIIKVEMEIRIPVGATFAQITEWLPHHLFQRGACALNNPLVNEEPEEWCNSFEWDDTGMIGTREEFDSVDIPGGRQYKVRFHRTRRAA